MIDRSKEVIQLVEIILHQLQSALATLRSANPSSFDRAAIAPDLLVILHTADELRAFFQPPPDSVEHHGVPRMMTQLEPEPYLVLRSEHGFDFRPWYLEKSSSLKWEASHLVSTWMGDPNAEARKSDPRSKEAYVEDLVKYLEHVRSYSHAILDMTTEGTVMIQEIRFGEEDAN